MQQDDQQFESTNLRQQPIDITQLLYFLRLGVLSRGYGGAICRDNLLSLAGDPIG